VKPGDVGVINRFIDSMTGEVAVDFSTHIDWVGFLFDLELADEQEAPAEKPIPKLGDRVRFRADIIKPRFGWHGARPGDVGKIIAFIGGDSLVRFPGHPCLIVAQNELEVVED
jgi:hypothetical protein